MKNWRVNLIFTFFFIFSLAISGRLFFLQILNRDFYKALSQGLHTPFNETEVERGEIFFRGGEPLAINIDLPFVFASPKKINNFEETAEALSQILSLDKNSVLEQLKKDKDKSYSLLKRKLTQQEVDDLKKLNLGGVYLDEEMVRYYPQENLASQVIGFLGAQGIGQYGLEESFNDILENAKNAEAKKGPDLTLTIDYNIQFEAEKSLQGAKENLEIESGQIIVIEPNKGEIIALANFPNFNPNQYEKYAQEENLEIFKNSVTQKLFEPGSVFKPITMAAALEEEKITPQTTYVDEGQVKVDGWSILNYGQRVYGEQTMTNVLEKSINTGAVFAQKQLGENLFLNYFEKFGFFEPTGIDIRETYPDFENSELRKSREINFATASFGQGIEMTPIQLARAYCAIANGGKLIKPYLVEKILENGTEINEIQPEVSSSIISSKTSRQLTAMLVSVVENGFAKSAKIPGYYIAGKTGTAQVAEGGVYSPDKSIQTFIGFAPAFDPKFLILIKLDNPKTKTAEYSAVPIFRDLAEYIIHYYQIPQDYE
jgi:cell division protein FtsI/penicillin-binding protein 2